MQADPQCCLCQYRLTDLHPAIGLTQIEWLTDLTEKRRANSAYLNNDLKAAITPKAPEGCSQMWHQYAIRVDGRRDRDATIRNLSDAGTEISYLVPVQTQRNIRAVVGDVVLPVVDRLALKDFCLLAHTVCGGEGLNKSVAEANRL